MSLTRVTALCPRARHVILCSTKEDPPDMTEKLLTGPAQKQSTGATWRFKIAKSSDPIPKMYVDDDRHFE